LSEAKERETGVKEGVARSVTRTTKIRTGGKKIIGKTMN